MKADDAITGFIAVEDMVNLVHDLTVQHLEDVDRLVTLHQRQIEALGKLFRARLEAEIVLLQHQYARAIADCATMGFLDGAVDAQSSTVN